MTLSEANVLCPGFRLRFIPKYGWGWKAPGDIPSLKYDQIANQGSFELVAKGTFKWKDELRGIYGVIDSDDHALKGYNFVLWFMSMGEAVIDPSDDASHRWDIFFSRQLFRDDHVDFPDQDEVGVGYGIPALKIEKTEPDGPCNRLR